MCDHKHHITSIIVAAALTAMGGVARADVIAGPPLTIPITGHTVSGLGFQALDNSTLTGFTFQNQGNADTVVLTDSVGNILEFNEHAR